MGDRLSLGRSKTLMIDYAIGESVCIFGRGYELVICSLPLLFSFLFSNLLGYNQTHGGYLIFSKQFLPFFCLF